MDKNRGDLYFDHPYSPTLFEQETELLYVHHSDGGVTEVLHSLPSDVQNPKILVLVPGFITILDSWEVFLQGIKPYFEIYYWESREKGTFHPPTGKLTRSQFSKERFATDLVEFIEVSNVASKAYILAGSSFGGTLIIDTVARNRIEPETIFLIGANIHFKLPFAGKLLAHVLPPRIMGWFKPAIRWYLRNFEVDRKTDEVQYQKYVKAVELANFRYIKYTVLNFHEHPQEHILKDIKVPTVVVGARLDKMHTIDETEFTTNEIEGAEMLAFETNKETHSEPFVQYMLQRFELI